ncbi:FAD binding domain-containing protein [Nonomuraea gerenzanensis]|uniref:Xanthine dehydrogenase, FAD binding subunit n=1 Tax=Nonomuraea gerenzanensis TaxID=93944 RepID=A0A1M4ED20_9ACTN|nr:FAD binding domain-containing protein [Nonomuraea gerenzanensis]UBU08369.1 FAD binding domain-containing protein [Nonomuraea gerenzanensis]SBO96710.1 Xanthine dehydrogenase, FAD binding subunit [Nonomuraea gerenzanensis]
MTAIELTINGAGHQVTTDPRTLLLHVLREELGLRGTKYGCGEGECGACTVLIDGRPLNACLIPAGRADGARVETIEGIAGTETGQAVIKALSEQGGVQCGFCTPGFVASITAGGDLSGNLCRCTGYIKIRAAVRQVLDQIEPRPPSPPGPRRAILGPAYARPATIADALRLLATDAPWRILAGGTDLLVQHEHRLERLSLLDITAIADFPALTETSQSVVIPALATYTDLRTSPTILRWAEPLATAAALVGGRQIQNAGTVGGNIVNASPAGDAIPALQVLGARIHLRTPHRARTVPISRFFTGPGRTRLAKGELVTHIEIPKTPPTDLIWFFDRVGTRRAQAITKASVAFRARRHESGLADVSIALGAVGPTVLEAPETAAFLERGPLTEERLRHAADLLGREAQPIDDIRSTARYRRRAVAGLLLRNLLPLAGRPPFS